jgi:hypothetical protein
MSAMTRNKDRKRIIRDRMKKTGESYTTARAHVIARKTTSAAPRARAAEYAALAGMADETISAKTGRTWKEWVRVLDADGASALPHREIATLLHRRHGVGDWWTQMVTVGYERIKGLRDRGQRRSGAYEVSKSKTFNAPVQVLFDAWKDDAVRRRWLNGVTSAVRTATVPKSLRLQWPDGAIIAVFFTAKGPAKSVVALAHTKLPDKASADRAKKYWTGRLEALATMLAEATV